MQSLNIFKALSLGDAKNIQRDSLLAWLGFAPILTALIVRIFLPRLTSWLLADYAFDVTPYTDAFMGYFLVLLTPMIVGLIIGFLLLDERDDQTLTALQVTPLPLNGYLLYRLGLPVLLSIFMSGLVFPLAGLAPLPFTGLAALALLAALEAPLYALFLASFAENKVAGLALLKGVSTLLMLPMAAYFVPSNWQLLAGLIPTYWPLKLFWLVRGGEAYGGYFLVGLAFHLLLLVAFLRRFDRVVHT